MFFKPGAFIGAAGRSMAFIQPGRNRDRDHAFLPHPLENGRIHLLSDAFFAGIGIGGIVRQNTGFRFTIQSESDKTDDLPITLADIAMVGIFGGEFRQLIPLVLKPVVIKDGIQFVPELLPETFEDFLPGFSGNGN